MHGGGPFHVMAKKRRANPALQALRDEAKRLNRSAGKKISRAKSVSGVYIAGTVHDPRRSASDIDRMRTRDLTRLIARQQSFVSRETQFVPDVFGAPLPVNGRLGVREYERKKAAHNSRVEAEEDRLSQINIPSINQTLGDRMRAQSKRPTRDRPANHPHERVHVEPFQLSGVEALKSMHKMLDRRQGPGYEQRLFRSASKAFKEMGYYIKALDPELYKRVEKLRKTDPKKFKLLWYHSPFTRNWSDAYTFLRDAAKGNQQAPSESTAQDSLEESRRIVNDIEALTQGEA